MKSPLAAAIVALFVAPALSAFASDPFPRPAELEPDVRFWTRVYTEVATDAGLIHDSADLGVVYDVVRFPKGQSSRSRERTIEGTKERYKTLLGSLARGKRTGLTADEARVLRLFPEGVSNQTLSAATKRLRFQLGQADKFRAGLIRSGRWEPHIRETFAEMGLPRELAALPHVESSYTPDAYSRIGAAGLWQFTRSTGRRFMRVDHVVDERLDPYRATIAAARLLEQNRQSTGSWPLAITAYNHGAAGMRRAVRNLGTRDIATVVRKYKSRSFGFASRNFYVEFLAAMDVDFHSEKYFGPLLMDGPIDYATVELPFHTSAAALQKALGVDMASLKRHNSALRDSVWSGAKYVPSGYAIRVPQAELARPADVAIANIPSDQQFARQIRDSFHTIGRGETLSGIARRYGLRMSEISALNGLSSSHRIRAGQKLRLPDPGGRRSVTVAHEPKPKPDVPIDPPIDGVYRVRRGDTLTSIAKRFGLDEQQLLAANRLRNRNRIYVGQSLRLTAETAPAEKTEIATVLPPPAKSHPATPASVSPVRPASEIPEVDTEIATTAEPGAGATDEPAEDTSLTADPNDYSVDGSGRIEVQGAETLGHYAEWLGIRASRLRQINGMRYGSPVVIGSRIKLEFGESTPEEFEQQRVEHHRQVQGEFFTRFQIDGTKVHVMQRGDSLWGLSQRTYGVPLWLLRQYNPDLDFGALHTGTPITIPLLRAHNGTASGGNPAQQPGSSEAKASSATPAAAGT